MTDFPGQYPPPNGEPGPNGQPTPTPYGQPGQYGQPVPYGQGSAPQYVLPVTRAQTRQFAFDGGAGTYVGTALLGFVITLFTLGLCYPFALVLMERWRAKHSYIEGRQMVFIGSAWGLFGLWWKWFLLSIVTLGIYSFWVVPRLYRWRWENTSWASQVPSY